MPETVCQASCSLAGYLTNQITPMNKTKKSFMLAAGATAIGFTALGGATAIHAAGTASTATNPESTLVQMLATKFNLSDSAVQAVFDQEHQNEQATRAANEKTRLDADVTAGKITAAQETLILAKQAEEQTFMESLKDKSQTDRQAAIKTEEANLTTWATTNNIPEQYVHLMGGPGGRGRPGGPDGGMPPTGSDSTTATQ